MAGFAVLLCAPRLVVFAPESGAARPMAASSYTDAAAIIPGSFPKGAVIPASLCSRAPLAMWGHPAGSERAAGIRRVNSSKVPDGKRMKVAQAFAERRGSIRMERSVEQRMLTVRETLASESRNIDGAAGETLVQETWIEAVPVSASVVEDVESGDGQIQSPAVQAMVGSDESAEGTVLLVRAAQYIETDAAGRPVQVWRLVLIQHSEEVLPKGLLNRLI